MAQITGLGVDDEAFLVSSLIDRCPRVMMLRELVQNAVEAAAQSNDAKEVRIGAAEVDGIRKLRIWNTGPGMDADALFRMCDIASSIGKIKGLDRNFGMGAKVASLPSNHHGVRFRSCASGRVNEVILGKRDGVYGRLVRPQRGRAMLPGSSRLTDVLDVTDEVAGSSLSLDRDWTEVVLLGMAPEQDTTTDPYAGDPLSRPFWLPQTLYHRYFDLPQDISVIIEPSLHWFDDARPFKPLRRRVETEFAGFESVRCDHGITLHYLHDPAHAMRKHENQSSEGALQTSHSLIAVVWRNEMYETQHGSPWLYEAPNFGLTFGGRHLSVLIELADDYPVLPDSYRQYLSYCGGEGQRVRTADFSTLVRQKQPGWVRRISRPQQDGRLMGEAMVADFARLAASLDLAKMKAGGGESWAPDDARQHEMSQAARAACGVEPVLLRDLADVRDRWLEGRAACFYPETKQLFINLGYPSLARFQETLRGATPHLADAETLEPLIKETSEAVFVRRLVRAVLFGLSKHLNAVNWQQGHIEKAISPEALSTVADDLDDQFASAILTIREQLSMITGGTKPGASGFQTVAVNTHSNGSEGSL